jgi:hypothetical protein
MTTTAQLKQPIARSQPIRSRTDIAKRAREELTAAMVALQHAGALFIAIEKASTVDSDLEAAFLLAQIGIETTAYQAERCNSECDYFDGALNDSSFEVQHG